MSQDEIALMAHLMRRAGFGATRSELEAYVAKGYEATVEELLHPEDARPALSDEHIIRRYHVDANSLMILELFSMGVGNYTETDVRQCSHAFTGWTIQDNTMHTARQARDSVWPYGRLDWQFEYRDDDHDDNEKQFLGESGAFNGEEVIDIIPHFPYQPCRACRTQQQNYLM